MSLPEEQMPQKVSRIGIDPLRPSAVQQALGPCVRVPFQTLWCPCRCRRRYCECYDAQISCSNSCRWVRLPQSTARQPYREVQHCARDRAMKPGVLLWTAYFSALGGSSSATHVYTVCPALLEHRQAPPLSPPYPPTRQMRRLRKPAQRRRPAPVLHPPPAPPALQRPQQPAAAPPSRHPTGAPAPPAPSLPARRIPPGHGRGKRLSTGPHARL